MKTCITLSFLFAALIIFVSPSHARRGNPVNAGTNTAPQKQFYIIDSDDDDPRAPTYFFVDTLYDPTNWHRVTGFTNNDDGYAQTTALDSFTYVHMDLNQMRLPPRYISTNGLVKLTMDSVANYGFGNPITSPNNTSMPVIGDGAIICPLWADMEFRTTGDSSKVFYRMTADSCFVTYYNLALKGTGGKVLSTFQIAFTKKDSSIQFNYRSFDGAFNSTPADTVFMNEATIGVQNYSNVYATMYLDRGTYYAISTGSQLYAQALHNGLAVKFFRVIPNIIRMRSIDNPPYDRYEMLSNSFQPQCTLENFTTIDRFIVVKSTVINRVTGQQVYGRTDSIEVLNHSTNQLSASLFSGFPCGSYRLTMSATIPSVGPDGWTQDNIITRDFTSLKTLTPPVVDNFVTLDPCNWHSDGATWVNASDVFCDPPAPYSTGAVLLNRRNINGQPYLSPTGSDTLTSVPIDLSGVAKDANNKPTAWLSFSYQRGLCTDSMKAGIQNRVMIGPETQDFDSLNIGTFRGDSLMIEGLLSTATKFNDTASSNWAKIGVLYGGLDYNTKKFRILLDPSFVHDHSRFRFRLAAKDDHLKYGFPLDDDDNWLIDAVQISAPINGQTDLEPTNIDLGAGAFTHIPRNVKLITPIVTIGNNGLLTNSAVYVVHLVIRDALNRAVYDKTGSLVTPVAHGETNLAMPVWDISGSQGGLFTAKINLAQNFNEYYRANDTNTFYRPLYIDDRYALDDGVPDTSGTMTAADNSFYYDFIPLANDSLRGLSIYNLGPSGNTNWTVTITDTATPTPKQIATRSFSYNADSIKGGFTTTMFAPVYMAAGTLYRIQCIETQGHDVGGDASRGYMTETTHSFNSPAYSTLHPTIVSSFRTSTNVDYVTAKRNAAGGGPLLPMMRLVFQGSSTFLPVEVASFTAKRTDLGSVNLAFRTAKEENVDHFDIDRESISGWINVGKLQATNDRLGSNYSLLDQNAPSPSQTYRLMEVDLDGSRTLIGTVAVGPFGSPEAFGVRVYPNPASQTIHVSLTGGADDVSLLLYDALGKVMAVRDHVSSTADIDASNLSNGSYWLEARTGDLTSRVRVAITK
jgi:hypothetical protein